MSIELGPQHDELRTGELRLTPVKNSRPRTGFICTPEAIEAHRQYLESMQAAIVKTMAKNSGAEESV